MLIRVHPHHLIEVLDLFSVTAEVHHFKVAIEEVFVLLHILWLGTVQSDLVVRVDVFRVLASSSLTGISVNRLSIELHAKVLLPRLIVEGLTGLPLLLVLLLDLSIDLEQALLLLFWHRLSLHSRLLPTLR